MKDIPVKGFRLRLIQSDGAFFGTDLPGPVGFSGPGCLNQDYADKEQ
jgi:hypothetical protein